jgi:spermidine/putrescine transport system ATP-binding protein
LSVWTNSACAPASKAANAISRELCRSKGAKLNVLLRPEDLRVDEIHHQADAEGLIGYIRERNYKGMTLESVVELENGKMVMVSEFFNEDDPDFDHSLDQKMVINWVESWEVVLADEEHK